MVMSMYHIDRFILKNNSGKTENGW